MYFVGGKCGGEKEEVHVLLMRRGEREREREIVCVCVCVWSNGRVHSSEERERVDFCLKSNMSFGAYLTAVVTARIGSGLVAASGSSADGASCTAVSSVTMWPKKN